jgi:hypothetical protein
MKTIQLAHMDQVVDALYDPNNVSVAATAFRASCPRTGLGKSVALTQWQMAFALGSATGHPFLPSHITPNGHGRCTVQLPKDLTPDAVQQGLLRNFHTPRPNHIPPRYVHMVAPTPPTSLSAPASARTRNPHTPALTDEQWASAPLTTPAGWTPLTLGGMVAFFQRFGQGTVTGQQLLDDPRRGTAEAFGHFMRDRGVEGMRRSHSSAGTVVMLDAHGRLAERFSVDWLDQPEVGGLRIMHGLRDLCGTPFAEHLQTRPGASAHFADVAAQTDPHRRGRVVQAHTP